MRVSTDLKLGVRVFPSATETPGQHERHVVPRPSLPSVGDLVKAVGVAIHIARHPRCEEATICTALAPEAVFTVRRCGETRELYDPV